MGTVRVFISYRRDMDAARATALRLLIETTFKGSQAGHLEIYHDVRERLGVEWPTELRDRIAGADVVLVLMGPEWLSAKDGFARRRIDQQNDWVRLELETALRAEKVVIPVLFGCTMPPIEALPDDLRTLPAQRGVEVRDSYLEQDLQPVLLEIERRLEGGDRRRSMPADSGGRLPYPDPPLKVIPTALDEDTIQRALHEMLDGWIVTRTPLPHDPEVMRQELHKEFRFDAFDSVLDFMRDASRFINDSNHHPRWENIYRTLVVNLSTWDAGHRVTYLDIMLAAYLDRLFRSRPPADNA